MVETFLDIYYKQNKAKSGTAPTTRSLGAKKPSRAEIRKSKEIIETNKRLNALVCGRTKNFLQFQLAFMKDLESRKKYKRPER